jgi:signal transduction histidine kinase
MRRLRTTAGAAFVALQQLAGGLGTAVPALVLLLLGSFTGPLAPRLLRGLADRERARLSRWGPDVPSPGPVPAGARAALGNPTVRRELRWLAVHATGGLLLGLVALTFPLSAIRDLTFPAWWELVPDGEAAPSLSLWVVRDWAAALWVPVFGLTWALLTLGVTPAMARLQARPGRRLLAPDPSVDLSLRVARLTATRAAALDAHAAELTRIERSLHDGTQNRLVAVSVLLGAARRALARNDPVTSDAVLEQAQQAAELALAELRAVARGILPPVLVDRGLAGALDGLAAGCPVPCQLEVDLPGRCAASVEATAYFAVAEALTNVAKHGGASKVAIAVRQHEGRLEVSVSDDGHGGADPSRGSGLTGIRGRVEAHDGTLTLTSPPGGPTTLRLELPCGS